MEPAESNQEKLPTNSEIFKQKLDTIFRIPEDSLLTDKKVCNKSITTLVYFHIVLKSASG